MLDPDFDPLELLQELAHEMVRLNKRQLDLERFFQELANNQTRLAEHNAHQQRELAQLFYLIGKQNNEVE